MALTFLMSESAGEVLQIALADGGTRQVMPAPGGSSNTGMLIFPTIAAMSAFNTAGLIAPGQQAYVQSNASVWTLKPVLPNALTPDGITVATGTPSTNQWTRENVSPALPLWLRVQAWWVDSTNVSGTASDENLGTSPTTALRTKAEIFRRWGYSWSPTLDGVHTVITYLSDEDGLGNDPGQFAPTFTNDARLIHQGVITSNRVAFTGTLASVGAKNRAGNVALTSQFVTTTGAMQVGLLLVNATRGNSRAFVVKDVGEGAFLLSQPLTPYVIASAPTSQTEVDTWANGDAITGYNLVQQDMPIVGGNAAALPADLGSCHVLSQLHLTDPAGAGDACTIDPAAAPLFVDVNCTRALSTAGANTGQSAYWLNVLAIDAPAFFATNTFNGLRITGGAYDTIAASGGLEMASDAQILTSLTAASASINNVFAQVGSSISAVGTLTCLGANYGGFQLNASSGIIHYVAPATTTLVGASTLLINAQGHAYSNLTTAGSVAVHQVLLSLTNLDAAAGATGFGGLAYNPGGGAISQVGVDP